MIEDESVWSTEEWHYPVKPAIREFGAGNSRDDVSSQAVKESRKAMIVLLRCPQASKGSWRIDSLELASQRDEDQKADHDVDADRNERCSELGQR